MEVFECDAAPAADERIVENYLVPPQNNNITAAEASAVYKAEDGEPEPMGPTCTQTPAPSPQHPKTYQDGHSGTHGNPCPGQMPAEQLRRSASSVAPSSSAVALYLEEIGRLRRELQGAMTLAEHRLQTIFGLQDALAAGDGDDAREGLPKDSLTVPTTERTGEAECTKCSAVSPHTASAPAMETNKMAHHDADSGAFTASTTAGANSEEATRQCHQDPSLMLTEEEIAEENEKQGGHRGVENLQQSDSKLRGPARAPSISLVSNRGSHKPVRTSSVPLGTSIGDGSSQLSNHGSSGTATSGRAVALQKSITVMPKRPGASATAGSAAAAAGAPIAPTELLSPSSRTAAYTKPVMRKASSGTAPQLTAASHVTVALSCLESVVLQPSGAGPSITDISSPHSKATAHTPKMTLGTRLFTRVAAPNADATNTTTLTANNDNDDAATDANGVPSRRMLLPQHQLHQRRQVLRAASSTTAPTKKHTTSSKAREGTSSSGCLNGGTRKKSKTATRGTLGGRRDVSPGACVSSPPASASALRNEDGCLPEGSSRQCALEERYDNAKVSLALLRGLVLRADAHLFTALTQYHSTISRTMRALPDALTTVRRLVVQVRPSAFERKVREGSLWLLSSDDIEALEVASIPGLAVALRDLIVAHDWSRYIHAAALFGAVPSPSHNGTISSLATTGTRRGHRSSSGASERGSSQNSSRASSGTRRQSVGHNSLGESTAYQRTVLESAFVEMYVNLHVMLSLAQSVSAVKQIL